MACNLTAHSSLFIQYWFVTRYSNGCEMREREST